MYGLGLVYLVSSTIPTPGRLPTIDHPLAGSRVVRIELTQTDAALPHGLDDPGFQGRQLRRAMGQWEVVEDRPRYVRDDDPQFQASWSDRGLHFAQPGAG